MRRPLMPWMVMPLKIMSSEKLTDLAQLFRRHYFQGHHHPGHQWPSHVPDLVSNDGTAQERQTRSTPGDHRSDRDERFFEGHGALEDRRGEQNPGLSQRDKIRKSSVAR